MIISKNAYLILWLDADSNEKSMNKRYKEMLKFLDIDEIPEYDSDFDFVDYNSVRTKENITEAFHNLSSQKKRIYQDFLWFQIVTNKDENLIKKLKQWKLIDAIDGWWDLYIQTWKFHYLKNRAIALLLWYENQNKFDDLDFSGDWPEIVNALYECINSEKFWNEFFKTINLSYDTPLSEVESKKFREEIVQYLAEEIFDLSEELEDPKIYISYSKKFRTQARELDDNKKVTKEFDTIDKEIKNIEKADLTSDLDDIDHSISIIKKSLKELDKLWLWNSSKVWALKDKIANLIMWIWVRLNNEHEDMENALVFLRKSKEIAHSQSVISKIERNEEIINQNLNYQKSRRQPSYSNTQTNKSRNNATSSSRQSQSTYTTSNDSWNSGDSSRWCWKWAVFLICAYIVIGIISSISQENNSKSSSSYSPSYSNSYTNNYTNTTNTSSYESDWKCKWSDGYRYTKPVHAYCDGWKTPLWWKCNAWYYAKSENNKTRLDSSRYCASNCSNFSCLNDVCSYQRKQIPTYVNEYSQSSINNYNAKVEAYNRCLSEKCYCR